MAKEFSVVQVILPARISQVCDVFGCLATAVQSERRLPRMLKAVVVMVTSGEGVNPLSGESGVAVPEKYWP